MILALVGVFLFVFGSMFLFFQFPVQGDDLGVVMSMILDHLTLFNHSEFQRSFVEGTGCFLMQTILAHTFTQLSSNMVQFMMMVFHLLNAIFLYMFIRNVSAIVKVPLLSEKKVAFVAALLFLLNVITVENYTNVSMAIRMVGLLFVWVHYLLLLPLFDPNRPRNNIKSGVLVGALILTGFLAFSFYEIYIFFLVIDIALLLLKPTRRIMILEMMVFVVCFLLLKVLSIMNIVLFTTSSGGLRWDVLAFFKTGLFYFSTILIPNVHGKILIGSFLHFPIMIISFWGLIVLLINKKTDPPLRIAIGVLALIIVLFMGLIFHNYYAPRLLYPIAPVLVLLISLGLFAFRDRLAYSLIGLLLLANVASLLHFAYLQDRAYKCLYKLKNVVIAEYRSNTKILVDYYPAGIRVFFPSLSVGEWERFSRAVVKTSGGDEHLMKLRVEYVKKSRVDTSGRAFDLFRDRLQHGKETTFSIQKND